MFRSCFQAIRRWHLNRQTGSAGVFSRSVWIEGVRIIEDVDAHQRGLRQKDHQKHHPVEADAHGNRFSVEYHVLPSAPDKNSPAVLGSTMLMVSCVRPNLQPCSRKCDIISTTRCVRVHGALFDAGIAIAKRRSLRFIVGEGRTALISYWNVATVSPGSSGSSFRHPVKTRPPSRVSRDRK